MRFMMIVKAAENSSAAVQRALSQAERISHRSTVWAEATDRFGKSAKAILSTPDPYDFSANSALEIASRLKGYYIT
jgi:hypothetical protein